MGPKHTNRRANCSSRQDVTKDKYSQDNGSPSRLSNTNNAVCRTSHHRTSSGTTAPRQQTKDAERCNTGNRVLAVETPILIYQDWDHDLRGIAAQFEDRGYALGLPPQRVALYHTATCPYHPKILESKHGQDPSACAADKLSSYLNGDPAEQYALYYRTDTDYLSTTKNCNCLGTGSNTGL